ncbi:MAG: hypothetical protein NXH95_15950 [Pseudomonadaceae bacterium]|nr:hypothetical protein [Pseudomonadaceae bacterium]
MSESTKSGRKPDFVAYSVKESHDGAGYWNKVGAAWEHKDGKGVEINLDSVPIDGRITLREMREQHREDYEKAKEELSPAETAQRSRGRSR